MDLTNAERLAALLDGNCSERERAELLAHLAADEEELEAYADAAAVLAELEAEDAAAAKAQAGASTADADPMGSAAWSEGGWTPPGQQDEDVEEAVMAGATASWGTGWTARHWGGVATVAVMMIGISLVWAALNSSPRRVAANFDPAPWSRVRGVAEGPSENDTADAVRLGANMRYLQYLAEVGHSDYRSIAREVAISLERLPAAGAAAGLYHRIAQDTVPPRELKDRLASAAKRAEGTSGRPAATRLGEWVQAARIAASMHDRGFFRKAANREVLRGEGEFSALLSGAGTQLDEVNAALKTGTPDWQKLEPALKDLLVHLTG